MASFAPIRWQCLVEKCRLLDGNDGKYLCCVPSLPLKSAVKSPVPDRATRPVLKKGLTSLEAGYAVHSTLQMLSVISAQDRLMCLVLALSLCLTVVAQKDFEYPTLWDPSTIATSSVDYADGPAKLKVWNLP